MESKQVHGMCESNETLRDELEKKTQLIYTLKNKLQLCEKLTGEIAAENETLKDKNNRIKLETNKRLTEHKKQLEEIKNEVANESNKCDCYHQTDAKDKEIKMLKASIEDLIEQKAHVNSEEYNKQIAANVELKNKYESLEQSLRHHRNQFDELFLIREKLEVKLKEANNTIGNLENNLKLKMDELAINKSLINDIQGELQLLKTEKPSLTTSRGNSVFAEVDDRRLQLQKNMANVNVEYQDIKEKYSNLLQRHIQSLKDNKEMCKQWKKDIREISIEEDEAKENLRNYLACVEDLVNNVKSYGEGSSLTRKSNNLKALLEEKEKQNVEMSKCLTRRSLFYFQLTHQLRRANNEVRTLRQNFKEFQVIRECNHLREISNVEI